MYNELLRVTIIVGLSNSTVISSSAGSYEEKKKKKRDLSEKTISGN
jgi:hypothetical protein